MLRICRSYFPFVNSSWWRVRRFLLCVDWDLKLSFYETHVATCFMLSLLVNNQSWANTYPRRQILPRKKLHYMSFVLLQKHMPALNLFLSNGTPNICSSFLFETFLGRYIQERFSEGKETSFLKADTSYQIFKYSHHS